MAVDTELLFHFSIKYDAPEEVVRIIKYLFSDNNHENMEDDEQLVLNFRSDPSDGLYADKQKEFIEKHCFKPSVSHKFFNTNTEPYNAAKRILQEAILQLKADGHTVSACGGLRQTWIAKAR